MSRRSIAGALGLALVLIILPATLAGAEFRGTDMWSNLAPGGQGGFSDKTPLSYYTLDYHVDGPSVGFSGVDLSDVPALVAQFLASFLFMLCTFFMRMAISAFDWAFNIDVIGGSDGTLGPVGQATQHLWFSTFMPLMTTGVLVLGGWMVYKLLARRFGEVATGLVRSACFVAAALAIIFNPAATIGKASSLVNDLSSAIVSGTTGGNGGQDVSRRMLDTFIYKPWAVLEFGGLRRCVSSATDGDGYPVPVGVGDPRHRICRDVLRQDAGGFGGYAPKFLRYAPGSDERKHLYEAIRDGKAPDDPAIAGWNVTKADAPAVDMMQGGGSLQRLGYAVLLCLGVASAILFLGLICFAALFAQLGLLVCLAATPAMAIAAIFPGTHGVVGKWAQWIGKLLIAKAMYALLLAAAVGVSAALTAASGAIGYLPVLLLQAALFFGLFIKRRALAEQVTSNASGYHRSENRVKSFVGGAAAGAITTAAAPMAAAGTAAAAGKARLDTISQQHAANPDKKSASASATDGSDGARHVDSSSPPASAGREYSPNPIGQPQGEPSTTVATIPSDTSATHMREEDPVPTKSFREDYQQAKAERAQDKPPAPAPQPHAAKPLHDAHRPESLAAALEQERAKTPST